jgi:hypothetical protein
MSTWEERMSQRAAVRAFRNRPDPSDPFAQWREPGDPPEIMPQILAARCLGIQYGDPGPRLPNSWCRQCWGDRHVWLGNAWGAQHTGDGIFDRYGRKCQHACHEGEVLLAG